MKLLVACTECHRQFDASDLAATSRFRCTCGQIIVVPEAKGHEAAVVRCSACGGPRKGNATVCGYCQAEFTLHEQDLQVLCAHCMTRVSCKAKFCHHCAAPIAPEGAAGRPSKQLCPVCEPQRHLSSRELGKEGLAILECPGCAGLWLGQEAFQRIAERARDRALPDAVVGPNPSGGDAARVNQKGPMYRKCPHCQVAMNRTNFATRSGVIVDRCKQHGIWFDSGELDAILRWITTGGEERSARRRAEQDRESERQEKLQSWRERGGAAELRNSQKRAGSASSTFGETLLDVLGSVLSGTRRWPS
jgi:Zn-finger nucleic acid-binding protein